MKKAIIAGVAAMVIGEVILRLIFSSNIFSFLGSLFKWIGGSLIAIYKVKLWGLILIGAIPVIILIVVISLIDKSDGSETSFRNYVSDIIYGVLWEWNYDHYGDIYKISMLSLCPTCKRELMEIDKTTYRGAGNKFNLKCPKCDFETQTMNGTYNGLMNSVIREIKGRIRTDEYQAE